MPLIEVYERTTTRFEAVEIAGDLPTAGGADPFLIDHGCTNAAGHQPIASCGAVVCAHCAVVFWS